jgi:putative ABC transport system permease protein
MVGVIGYALGVAGTVAFIAYFEWSNAFFKGFYVPWWIPLFSALAVMLILAITGYFALRSVLSTEPAAVFR